MKHRWRTDLNWLCGIRTRPWLRLVATEGVDPAYWHRGVQITGLALFNSAMARVEMARHRDVPAVAPPAPVFIVGHWRSGTTWLYHLLATHPGLVAPNAWQTINPTTFRVTEPVSERWFGGLLPDKRVQDDVPMAFHLPEEDEYAVGLTSGCTPYLGRSFPRRLAHYERFLTLDDCTDAEREAFRDALVGFMARLAAAGTGAVLLKSPAHTARVRWLLDWFPDARFVHIHRDPYRVFQSTRHLYDTVDWFWAMQRRDTDWDATILRQYAALHRAWFDARDQIPAGQLVELGYDQLVADPLAALTHIGDTLGLGHADEARARWQASLADQPAFRTNAFPPLPEADKARVRAVAGPCFEAWGYPA